MPEKPEVQQFADALGEHLRGKTLSSLQFDERSRYREKRPENCSAFISSLPSLINRVWSKGKKVIICLENGMALLSSLSMEGRWIPTPMKHTCLTLRCEDGTIAYFDDSRHQGLLEIFDTAAALEDRLAGGRA